MGGQTGGHPAVGMFRRRPAKSPQSPHMAERRRHLVRPRGVAHGARRRPQEVTPMKLLTTSMLVLTCLFGTTVRAFETVVDEPSAHDYHFVSHYRVQIDAEVKDVWQHITNLKSWMYEFELTQLTGSPAVV